MPKVRIARAHVVKAAQAMTAAFQEGPAYWSTTPGLGVATIGFIYGRLLRDCPQERAQLEVAFGQGAEQGLVPDDQIPEGAL